jgi:hypothetical protein
MDSESNAIIVHNPGRFNQIEILGLSKYLELGASLITVDSIRAGQTQSAEEATQDAAADARAAEELK